MTGRGHQLIHSDAFAAELEAIGLDQSIFGPHLPAPVFQALVPRKAGVFDEHAHTFGTGDEPATFARASDGIYLDADGDYKVAAAAAIRAEYDASGNFLGYLFEPAITNKCTNYNANPDAGLTNITKVGDAASVVRRVLDVSELEAAGLSGICSTGYVLELDNSLGVADAALQFGGNAGNTNAHSGSAWCRYVSGSGQADLRMNDNAFITPFTHTTFQRVSGTGTPSLTTIRLRLQCAAGTIARIVVNQYEELPVITSPIITLGASGTRATDTLTWGALAGFFGCRGRYSVALAALLEPIGHTCRQRDQARSLEADKRHKGCFLGAYSRWSKSHSSTRWWRRVRRRWRYSAWSCFRHGLRYIYALVGLAVGVRDGNQGGRGLAVAGFAGRLRWNDGG